MRETCLCVLAEHIGLEHTHGPLRRTRSVHQKREMSAFVTVPDEREFEDCSIGSKALQIDQRTVRLIEGDPIALGDVSLNSNVPATKRLTMVRQCQDPFIHCGVKFSDDFLLPVLAVISKHDFGLVNGILGRGVSMQQALYLLANQCSHGKPLNLLKFDELNEEGHT
jgi:hypothetical protein